MDIGYAGTMTELNDEVDEVERGMRDGVMTSAPVNMTKCGTLRFMSQAGPRLTPCFLSKRFNA